MALEKERRVRILYCKNFHDAAKYAAERDWWLHSWVHHFDVYAPDEVVEFVKVESSPVSV